SVMSGLTPTASVDDVLGLEGVPDPLTAMSLPAAEQRVIGERRREKFREWKRDELVDALRACNHAVDPILPAGEVLRHPQTIANEMAVTVLDPDAGETTQMGVPIHLVGTPGAVQGPQPAVGAHTDEVLGSLPVAPPRTGPRPPGGDGGTALDGLRVIDFGQYLAGPFGPMILADLGADVVKVEPVTGDGMRLAGKPFSGCQRGKRSLALDLKQPAGLEVAMRLVGGADVVHHNMTRGVATKLGIDYTACRAVRPDVDLCGTRALYRLYRTQDDAWICVAAERHEHWRALARVLGAEALADDERFATYDARRRHRTTLEAELAPRFLTRTARAWTRLLDDARVPNELPVDTVDGRSTLHDDDNVRLGLVADYE